MLDTLIPTYDFPISSSQAMENIYRQYQELPSIRQLGVPANWRLVSHPYQNNGYGRPFIVNTITLPMILDGIPNLMIMTRQDAEAYIANPPDRP